MTRAGFQWAFEQRLVELKGGFVAQFDMSTAPRNVHIFQNYLHNLLLYLKRCYFEMTFPPRNSKGNLEEIFGETKVVLFGLYLLVLVRALSTVNIDDEFIYK